MIMTFDELMIGRLATDAEEAAALLRLALEEVKDDPRGLLLIVQHITTARGDIDDLGLSDAEKISLASALSRSLTATTLLQAA